jgi:hypothetical protein
MRSKSVRGVDVKEEVLRDAVAGTETKKTALVSEPATLKTLREVGSEMSLHDETPMS